MNVSCPDREPCNHSASSFLQEAQFQFSDSTGFDLISFNVKICSGSSANPNNSGDSQGLAECTDLHPSEFLYPNLEEHLSSGLSGYSGFSNRYQIPLGMLLTSSQAGFLS